MKKQNNLKTLLLILVILLILSGCHSSSLMVNDALDFSRSNITLNENPYPILCNEFDMTAFLDQVQLEDVTMVDAYGYLVDFIGWRNNTAMIYSADTYSNRIMLEADLGEHDIFLDMFKLDGKMYPVFLDSASDGFMQVTMVDIAEEKTYEIGATGKIPFVAELPDQLVFSIRDPLIGDVLLSFDGKEITERYQFKNKENPDSTMTGSVVTAMTEWNGSLLVQIAEPKRELLDNAETKIMRFDSAFHISECWDFKEAYDFLSGQNGMLIASVHAYPEPMQNCGRLIDFEGKSVKSIPTIYSGNSIYKAGTYNSHTILVTECGIQLIEKDEVYVLAYDCEQNDTCIDPYMGIVCFDGRIVRRIFEDTETVSEEFPEKEKEKICSDLICSDIHYMGEGKEYLYYMETSDYAYLPYSQVDGIVWMMNKATGECKKVFSFVDHYWSFSLDDHGVTVQTEVENRRFEFK